MSQKNVRRPPIILLLLLQTFSIVTSATPFTNPVSLLKNTTIYPASPSNQDLTSHNVTSPSNAATIIDYRINGTPLALRITETGRPFAEPDVAAIIDAAIREVVQTIIAGRGNQRLHFSQFLELSRQIDMRITELQDANFTYFLLGDVLAGIWQFMNEPWSGFQEIVFDVMLESHGWGYIGYGRLARSMPDPPLFPYERVSSLRRKIKPRSSEVG